MLLEETLEVLVVNPEEILVGAFSGVLQLAVAAHPVLAGILPVASLISLKRERKKDEEN